MNGDNFKKSGNGLEALLRAWNIHGMSTSDKWLKGYNRVPNVFLMYMNELKLGGSQASLGMLLQYLISLDFGNRKGYCFPGHSVIAKNLRLSVKSIERGLKNLETLGMIEIERRMDEKGNFYTNIYTWEGFKTKLRQLLIRDGLIVEQRLDSDQT